MYVLVLLALAPFGLLAVMGMSWVEEPLLPPPGVRPAHSGLAAPAPGATAAPAAPRGGFPASCDGTARPAAPGRLATWQQPERNH
jgi:hypothetical protein